MKNRWTTAAAITICSVAAAWSTAGWAVEGAGALGQATVRDGAMSGGAYVEDAPLARTRGNARVYPRAGDDSLPRSPSLTGRLGADDDNDFSGSNEVQGVPPNTNPDRRQLENAFDD